MVIERTPLAVRGLLIRSNTEVLLASHVEGDYTFLPGKHLQPGKSLVAGLRQAIRDDLGAIATVGPYLGAVEYQMYDRDAGDYELSHIFRVDLDIVGALDHPRSLQPHLRFVWCPADGLASANLQPVPLQRLISLYLNWDRSPWWATNVLR